MKFAAPAVAIAFALMHIPAGAAPVGAAPVGAPPAAAPQVVSRITAKDLAQLLSRVGFLAFEDEDKGEKVVVPIGFFVDHTIKSEVRLLECGDGGCSRLVFKAWPKRHADLDWTNRWNRRVPFGLVKASLLTDKTVRLEMTVDLTGGVAPKFIEQSAFAFVTIANRVIPNSGLD